ncbi:MAG: sulfatase-like hydrolase/transferase [Candidatus Aminicenantes bacterium]|nr:sulfatase-like hydrolase/transferase [Candidatus Aminicenantes bacterium]
MKRIRLHVRPWRCPFLACIVLGLLSVSPLRGEGAGQNCLLITIDTLRADRLSCYGSSSPKTPNIDSLAGRGVVFSRAFANTSTTLPSHVNILLGTTPNYHGVHENLNFVVSQELLTLAEHLKDNGYSTGAFVGAYPLDSRFGLSQGFDVYDDQYSRVHSVNLASLERNAEAVIEAALEWLRGRKSPWFLWIHCWDPHSPYDPPEPFKTQYKDHLYEGEVAYVDLALGNLFDYLNRAELIDSTVLVFTGDHGESLGQHGEETHGFFAYNSSLWIPLIISAPQCTPARIDDYVSHIDIFPTVCDALGIQKPPFLQGHSLFPALKGKKLAERPIYFESMYPYYSRGWAPLKGFILKKKKFIDSPLPELYDLTRDFDELDNLVSESEKEAARLRAQLNDIIRDQMPSHQVEAVRQPDRQTREKLASLGYVSSGRVAPKNDFSARDDVKILLPYINKIGEGWKLYKGGRADEGIQLLKEIIGERDDIDLAYKQLAAIYQEQGRREEAIMILEQGLEALPLSYEIYAEYVRMLVSAGQYDRIISSFKKMSWREAEHDPEIWNNLGTAYAKTGDFDEAIKAFEVGLSLDDKHPELYNNLANACYSHGLQSKDASLYSRCFEYYRKAIELDPEYAAPYYGLGHAYRQQGNMEGAISCWGKALEADPHFTQAHLDLAMAYFNTGDKAKALDLFSEFKKRYYQRLSPADREKLDSLIEQCRKEPE